MIYAVGETVLRCDMGLIDGVHHLFQKFRADVVFVLDEQKLMDRGGKDIEPVFQPSRCVIQEAGVQKNSSSGIPVFHGGDKDVRSALFLWNFRPASLQEDVTESAERSRMKQGSVFQRVSVKLFRSDTVSLQ